MFCVAGITLNKTEKSYIHWIKHFVAFHGMKTPRNMGAPEVEAFLTHLAVVQNVAPSTQNQAFSALVFLYREVYQRDTNWNLDAERATPTRYLPTVLTPKEVQSILKLLPGVYQFVAKVLYGGGLRLSEGLKLRVKDLDFAQRQIVVRDGKGRESRVTMRSRRMGTRCFAHPSHPPQEP
jgi:integrase